MGIVLGPNQYGKAGVRLVRVDRHQNRDDIRDLTVGVALTGDMAAAHRSGDNAAVLPTDTQKNTVYAFAAERGVGELEAFALALACHFVDSQPTIATARVSVAEQPWDRVGDSDHCFARHGGESRTATVSYDGTTAWAVSGLRDLTLLKTAGSEFRGYIRDRYTTLAETSDRILATDVTARWRHAAVPLDGGSGWDSSYAAARRLLIETFAGHYSRSLQQTLYAMGERVLAERHEIAEIRLSLPNKHHLTVDLSAFGLDNPGQVLHVPDRPYGLIEGTVLRDDAPPPGLAWVSGA
ncbi:MAG TPA: urate oxidase [Streptosporangiaceae bacterium]|nr:urate oxidase [Streptosporangiaceae bacterium]